MVLKTTMPLGETHPLNRTLMALAKHLKWQLLVKAYASQPQHYPLSIDDARKLFGDCRWRRVAVSARSIINTFATKEDFAQWMLGWMGAMPAIATLEKARQQEVSDDFAEEYIKLPEVINKEGSIVYEIPGILIDAVKAN